MIRYALRCSAGHAFDSWFQSADAYDALAGKGLVACAVCGSPEVTKALMAPRVAGAGDAEGGASTDTPDGARPGPGPLRAPAHPAEQMLRALRDHLSRHSTYVGGRFASEARAMHLGEAEMRPIHGEARPEEARALIEEGVPIAPLPILPPNKAN